MSADNGVYVLGTVRDRRQEGRATVTCKPYKVYRIAHAQAIDNFEYYQHDQTYNLGCYMQEIWGQSKVYTTKEDALKEAHNVARLIENLEYGVVVIETDFKMYHD